MHSCFQSLGPALWTVDGPPVLHIKKPQVLGIPKMVYPEMGGNKPLVYPIHFIIIGRLHWALILFNCSP